MSKEISRAMERSINDLADDEYEVIYIELEKPGSQSAVIDQTGEVTYHDVITRKEDGKEIIINVATPEVH